MFWPLRYFDFLCFFLPFSSFLLLFLAQLFTGIVHTALYTIYFFFPSFLTTQNQHLPLFIKTLQIPQFILHNNRFNTKTAYITCKYKWAYKAIWWEGETKRCSYKDHNIIIQVPTKFKGNYRHKWCQTVSNGGQGENWTKGCTQHLGDCLKSAPSKGNLGINTQQMEIFQFKILFITI